MGKCYYVDEAEFIRVNRLLKNLEFERSELRLVLTNLVQALVRNDEDAIAEQTQAAIAVLGESR